jgi:hypothetical protein
MVVGAIVTVVSAAVVYFVTKYLGFIQRERISSAALVGATACFATAGFLVDEALGFAALAACLAALGLLLGYEAGE